MNPESDRAPGLIRDLKPHITGKMVFLAGESARFRVPLPKAQTKILVSEVVKEVTARYDILKKSKIQGSPEKIHSDE